MRTPKEITSLNISYESWFPSYIIESNLRNLFPNISYFSILDLEEVYKLLFDVVELLQYANKNQDLLHLDKNAFAKKTIENINKIDSRKDLFIGYKNSYSFNNNKVLITDPFIYSTYGEDTTAKIVPKYYEKQFIRI